MAKTHHFKGFSVMKGDIKVKVKFNRFERQFAEAQYWLDGQIMTDMTVYMPKNTNMFIDLTRGKSAAVQGTGIVYAAVPPSGRFLYEGLVMVDPVTNSPWARKGAKKVVTDRPLNYSNPKAVSHWFDESKEVKGESWVKGVKRRAGGG